MDRKLCYMIFKASPYKKHLKPALLKSLPLSLRVLSRRDDNSGHPVSAGNENVDAAFEYLEILKTTSLTYITLKLIAQA